MGAGCSNGRALAVQDSVTKKQISITSEGRDHLRNISSQLNTSMNGFYIIYKECAPEHLPFFVLINTYFSVIGKDGFA
jgi:hypothetical protein